MGASGRLKHTWRFLKEVSKEYIRDNCSMMAAAISFYVLLSLIPLLLVGLSSFGYILGDKRASEAVSQFLGQFVPAAFGGAAVSLYLKENFRDPRITLGILGLGGGIWTASIAFHTITEALNLAWEARRPSGYVVIRLRAIAMVLVTGVLGLSSFTITSVLRIVRQYRIPWGGMQPGEFPLIWRVLGWGIPVALSILIFVLCYAFLADVRIGWRPALRGGLVAGILWEAAKQGFAFYIANFAHYNKLYGSLGGLVILVMWVYYSAAILLVGGEVAGVTAAWAAPAPGKVRRRKRR